MLISHPISTRIPNSPIEATDDRNHSYNLANVIRKVLPAVDHTAKHFFSFVHSAIQLCDTLRTVLLHSARSCVLILDHRFAKSIGGLISTDIFTCPRPLIASSSDIVLSPRVGPSGPAGKKSPSPPPQCQSADSCHRSFAMHPSISQLSSTSLWLKLCYWCVPNVILYTRLGFFYLNDKLGRCRRTGKDLCKEAHIGVATSAIGAI